MKTEIQKVFNSVVNENVITICKVKNNLANEVYKVITKNNKYIVKKYNYNYDFDVSDLLYNLYEKNNINVVKPINNKLIKYNNNKYNVFNYIDSININKVSDKFLMKLLNTNRKINKNANLIQKCDKYYNYLITLSKYRIKEEKSILKEYIKLKNKDLLKDKYLNHGDISKKNILYNGEYNIIDFDETIITTELYDFAVIVVKNKVTNNAFEINSINKLISKMNKKYNKQDYQDIIKFYLCKILMEKFYLYELNIIDLFSREQQKDNYEKYIKLFNEISNA